MKSIKFLLVILFSLAVVACGGGYGGSARATNGYSISGTVSTGLAHPVFLSGVTINLTGASMATTTTAWDGNYSFTGLLHGELHGDAFPLRCYIQPHKYRHNVVSREFNGK